ncbi:hypothetical protein AAG906_025782 [Vitis piasezkii]
MARGGQHNNDNRFHPSHPLPRSTATQSDQSLMENTNNPFFLHSGDHPCLVLVCISSLVQAIIHGVGPSMALNVRIILDSWMALFATHDRRPYSQNPPRCNNMVTSWLLNAVSKEIVNSLLYLESAHAVWADRTDASIEQCSTDFPNQATTTWSLTRLARC